MDNGQKLNDGRKIIIDAFKYKAFPFGRHFEDEDEDGCINFDKLDNLIYRKERGVRKELIQKRFKYQNLKIMLKELNKSKTQREMKFR